MFINVLFLKSLIKFLEKEMEKTQKIIVILLIVAIVFSAISTLLNLSLINFDFQPVNVKIPSGVSGNPTGNIVFVVEANQPPSG
jgi:hypothetical protein